MKNSMFGHWLSQLAQETDMKPFYVCSPSVSVCALVATVTLSTGLAAAEQFGTPDEAKAMLVRAVATLKADQQAAIIKFNHNDPNFRDRDLFVFCFNGHDGKFTAHEAFVGSDVRGLADRVGTQFGAEMFAAPAEARIIEVAYLSPLPGSVGQAPKLAYVVRIGDQVCGVSAYALNKSGDTTH
jgi:hypothetical protein